jgi:hypothetical protein
MELLRTDVFRGPTVFSPSPPSPIGWIPHFAWGEFLNRGSIAFPPPDQNNQLVQLLAGVMSPCRARSTIFADEQEAELFRRFLLQAE